MLVHGPGEVTVEEIGDRGHGENTQRYPPGGRAVPIKQRHQQWNHRDPRQGQNIGKRGDHDSALYSIGLDITHVLGSVDI